MSYSFVNAAYAAATSIAYSPTIGNQVIVAVGNGFSSGTPSATVSDNLASSYAIAAPSTAGGIYFLTAQYLLSAPPGISTISVTWAGGNAVSPQILVLEYSGFAGFVGASTPNYVSAPGTGANAIVSGAVTVASPPVGLIGIAYNPTANPCTAGTSPIAFTQRFSTGGEGMSAEDVEMLSGGSPKVTFTTINSGNNFLVAALAFAETQLIIPDTLMGQGWV